MVISVVPVVPVLMGRVSRGLLLYRLNRRDAAIECALLSLQRYLWNWSAWDLLSNLINDGEEVGA
jgi:anaphase-promoting complex subunit 8